MDIDPLTKAAAEIAKPVYEDAIQPVAKEVGQALKTLGGVINVALAPVALAVYGFSFIKKDLEERLEKRLSSVPPENIVIPKLQLVGPLLEKYKYTYESEELSEMFVNLLANAMDKDRVEKAHPSFVNVVSELSSDEAKLIKAIALADILPKLDIRLNIKPTEGVMAENQITGYLIIEKNFTLLGKAANLQYPELTPSYLSNLERLAIISCSPTSFSESYASKDNYKELEADPHIQEMRKKNIDRGEMETIQGVIEITDFGKMFIAAVINPSLRRT